MNTTKSHIEKSLEKGIRFDGRKLDEYRNVTVELGVSKNAEGSARVKIGETEIIVGVKLALEKPYPDAPDEGTMMVNTELLPLSSPDFESGPPGIQAIEIARVVDRGIRESKTIDVKKLCVEKGEKVWCVLVDICTINDAGNLFDAASLGTLAAILDTRFPEYDGTEIDYKKKTDKKLPLTKQPLAVTVLKIGSHLIVDPVSQEEAVYDARLTLAATEEGRICAMQKGGDCPLNTEDINNMVDLALLKIGELRKKL